MSATKFVLVVTLVVVGASAAPPAFADDTAEVEKAKREARVLMKAGVDAFTRRDWPQALEMFEAAYTRYPSAKILLNIGSTMRELGRQLDAARAYEKYLQDPGSDAGKRNEVSRLLAELDRSLGKLRAALSETDAEVTLDGNRWDNPTVVVVRVNPGDHQIRAEKAGFVPVELTVAVGIGEEKVLEIALVREQTRDPSETDPAVTRVAVRDGLSAEQTAGSKTPRGAARSVGFRALLRAAIDYKLRGAAALVGVGVRVGERFEAHAAGLLGPSSGFYVGGTVYVLPGTLRPLVSLGTPVLFSNGARVAVRGAIGIEWALAARISVTAELGVEHFFNPEDRYPATMVVPVVGVGARL